jgi:hypothetical protein
LRISFSDSLAGLVDRPGQFMCALATLAIPIEAADDKRVFSPPSKNASARAGDDVPAGDGFATRRQFPAVDKISVLTR